MKKYALSKERKIEPRNPKYHSKTLIRNIKIKEE